VYGVVKPDGTIPVHLVIADLLKRDHGIDVGPIGPDDLLPRLYAVLREKLKAGTLTPPAAPPPAAPPPADGGYHKNI
jgi:hypothetical protein